MKKQVQKISISIVAFLLSLQMVSAQKADTSMSRPSDPMYDRYMQRHKTFKTVGWVLLAPGATMIVIGTTSLLSSNLSSGDTIGTIGTVMAFASLPFFVTSWVYAGKAKRAGLQLKSGTVPGPNKFNYVALALHINL